MIVPTACVKWDTQTYHAGGKWNTAAVNIYPPVARRFLPGANDETRLCVWCASSLPPFTRTRRGALSYFYTAASASSSGRAARGQYYLLTHLYLYSTHTHILVISLLSAAPVVRRRRCRARAAGVCCYYCILLVYSL